MFLDIDAYPVFKKGYYEPDAINVKALSLWWTLLARTALFRNNPIDLPPAWPSSRRIGSGEDCHRLFGSWEKEVLARVASVEVVLCMDFCGVSMVKGSRPTKIGNQGSSYPGLAKNAFA